MPFTVEQFFSVFERYNQDLPYAGTVLAAIAVLAVVLSISGGTRSGNYVAAILALMWAWAGAVYHIYFFAEINPAAYLFGGLFLIQAAVFGTLAIRNSEPLRLEWRADIYGWAGAAIIAYALVIYPILGRFAGHEFPRNPTFGLPCPLTIFTFAILLWSSRAVPRWVLAVPAIWALIGSFASLLFGVWEDLGLIIAAAVTAELLVVRQRKNY